jgi:hypothetical protein
MATVRRDGTPASVATWYRYRGGQVMVSILDSAVRLKHLRANPMMSLTVVARQPDRHVTLGCRVVELREDPALRDLDELSWLYEGRQFIDRTIHVTTAIAHVERWYAFGFDPDQGASTT